ncbi:IQ domain-containing protein IQM5-like [Rosa chinensis]|uniref:IQ domain-containing protein IQM5-like n=1 Tax=Rosa chinensis TaxID=74649 RepID=UPI001AD8E8C6|nr:IQ domain-containing protein IQM5-like [Rosa chinensis]
MYYDLWFESQSSQPFFYWLNVGDGKETNLELCSRTVLQSQCIKYLGPVETEFEQQWEMVRRKNGKMRFTMVNMFGVSRLLFMFTILAQ